MLEPNISVGILQSKEIKFKINGNYLFMGNTNISQGCYSAVLENSKIVIIKDGEKITEANEMNFITDDYVNSSFTLFDVVIGINFHWEKKENQIFLGSLKLIIEDGEIYAVNVLPIEHYITSVISSEMSATSSAELLKAHAIISRSWLLAQIEKKKEIDLIDTDYCSTIVSDEEIIKWYDREDHVNFDVCADDHCQRYQGITKQYEQNCQVAVKNTFGEVLLSNDMICDARFSKSCGGISESFENVWENVEHSYLKKVIDNSELPAGYDLDLTNEDAADKWIRNSPNSFCNTVDEKVLSQVLLDFDQSTKDFYRWEVEYSQKEIQDLLKVKLGIDFGNIIDLIPIERGYSGRLIRLKIVGSNRTLTIGKELEIRRVLSESHLYSSAFVVDKIDVTDKIPNKFKLIGSGWGHGVGLCQIGAAVMGEKGYSYKEILSHYFIDAQLRKIY